MSKVHKNAEVIKAWADGKAIQWQTADGLAWIDYCFETDTGPWAWPHGWRIKPEPKKGWVRVAEQADGNAKYTMTWHKWDGNAKYTMTWHEWDGNTEAEIESLACFIRWLSPRFDFDYPEDYEGGK